MVGVSLEKLRTPKDHHDPNTVSIASSIYIVAIDLKKRKKTKISKNRAIMVVSDHYRTAQSIRIALFR